MKYPAGTASSVLKENQLRNDELFSFFNPETGEGSEVPRVRIDFRIHEADEDEITIFWPKAMFRECK